MLGIDTRAFRVAWTIFLFVLLFAVIYYIRETLILFAVAIFFAYMLSPLVDLMARFMPRRRTQALAVVYFVLLTLLVTVGLNLGATVAEQATSLLSRLPALVTHGDLNKLPLPHVLEPVRAKVIQVLHNSASDLESSMVPFLQRAGTQILSGLRNIVPVVLVPILAFLFLLNAREIRSAFISLFDTESSQIFASEILDDFHQLLSKYIRALVLLSLASFVAWFVFLLIIRAPYQLLLAGIAGVFEFIPLVGPLTAGVVTVIVCGTSGTGSIIWIIVFFVVYRLVQDYMLNPYLMSSGVQVSPLLVLFGVLAGEQLGGIPGMFFSVPVIAMLRLLYARVKTHQQQQLTASNSVVALRE